MIEKTFKQKLHWIWREMQFLFRRTYSRIQLQLWFKLFVLIVPTTIMGYFVYNHLIYSENKTDADFVIYLFEHLVPDLIVTIFAFLILKEGIDFLTGMAKVLVKPTGKIIESIRSSKETKVEVRILDTFIATYLEYHNDSFIKALEEAIRRGVRVQILVLHPNSNAAKQRNIDLLESKDRKNLNLQWLMKQNLAKLYNLKLKLRADRCEFSENLEIYLYNSTPPFAFISWDSNAYISFFKNDSISDTQNNLRITIESKLGRFIEDTFNNIYDAKKKNVDIERYMTLRIFKDDGIELFNDIIYYCGEEGREDYPNYITFKYHGEIKEYLDSKSKAQGMILVQTEKGIETMVVIQKYKKGVENYDLNIERFQSRYDWNSNNMILDSLPFIYELQSLKETRQHELFHLDSNFVSKILKRKKYVMIPGSQILDLLESDHGADKENINKIKKDWDNLVTDPYLLEIDSKWNFRERRIRFFSYEFETDRLEFSDKKTFEQPRDYGKRKFVKPREFELINEDTISKPNDFIQSLIRFDLLNMCNNEELTKSKWSGILHFIRIKASPSLVGKPSPEDIHTDGHDLLAIHLLEKSNGVKGGINHIYTSDALKDFNNKSNKQFLIEQVPLYSTLDTLYIKDKDVKHYATDLYSKDNQQSGYRDVIIIDFERINES